MTEKKTNLFGFPLAVTLLATSTRVWPVASIGSAMITMSSS